MVVIQADNVRPSQTTLRRNREAWLQNMSSPTPLDGSALDSVDFAPPTLHDFVIIGHALPDHVVGHELLLNGEEVVDPRHGSLGDDGPERLTGDIGEQAKRFMPELCQRRR